MTSPRSDPSDSSPLPRCRSANDIRDWLVGKISAAQATSPAEVRTDAPLIGMGLDSMQFVVLVGELEQWLGCRFTDNPLMDYPTIDALAAFLAEQLAQGKTLIDPAHG